MVGRRRPEPGAAAEPILGGARRGGGRDAGGRTHAGYALGVDTASRSRRGPNRSLGGRLDGADVGGGGAALAVAAVTGAGPGSGGDGRGPGGPWVEGRDGLPLLVELPGCHALLLAL